MTGRHRRWTKSTARLVGGLVVLAAVADAHGFGRAAAERLGMTQSGVSKAIAELEEVPPRRQAGSPHEPRGPTHGRGSRALRTCRRASGRDRRRPRPRLRQSRDAVRGRLRVNVDPLFSRAVLSPKLSAFLLQQSAPGGAHRNPRPHRRFGQRRLRSGGPFRRAGAVGTYRPPHSRWRASSRSLRRSISTRHGRPDHPEDLASARSPMHPERSTLSSGTSVRRGNSGAARKRSRSPSMAG